jgi:hypothetical protein
MVNLVYLPLALLSGLWLPLSALPKVFSTMAPLWPTWHLAQLALPVVGLPSVGSIAGHLLVLLAVTVVALLLAPPPAPDRLNWHDRQRSSPPGFFRVVELACVPAAPAPDSAVADLLRRGKSPWSGAIHLLWSVWIFLTPVLGNGFTVRWLLLTLASYPLFLLLYAKVMLAPRHHAWRYALGMIVMALVLLPWYPSGLSYFVFGCVMIRMSSRGGWWVYLLQLTGLNLLFCGALYFGYPWQAMVWMPAVSFIVGLVVNVEALSQQRTLPCSCPRTRCGGWRPPPSASASAATCTTCWATPCR